MSLLLHLASASSSIDSAAKSACGSSCGGSSIDSIFSTLSNALIFLVGAISVIMIIVGGLRYVLSSGDPKAAADAKNTILYSVVGIVVAIAAYAIVHFVATHIS